MDDRAPYEKPVMPFRLDDDGDVVDANGWLVACPAYSVWPDDGAHRRAVLDALNGQLLLSILISALKGSDIMPEREP